MKKRLFVTFLVLYHFSLSAGGVQDQGKGITLYIAASTTDVISDAAVLYQEKTGVSVQINPASSGTLANQIEQGAPADVYISASRKWMDYVETLGAAEDVSSLVRNRLVLIAPSDSPDGSFILDGNSSFPSSFEGYLSMGDPEHVPAGKYAREALTYFGWFGELEPRMLPAADVRAALSVVELGEAERGIVYETDAEKSGRVRILGAFPEESHTPVEYFCALLSDAGEEAGAFYEFLLHDQDVKDLFTRYGFTVK